MPTAVITGASSGLGRALVELLSIDGYQTLIISRSKNKLKKIADKINSNGGNCISCAADLSDPKQVMELQDTIKNLKDISIFINNAGIGFFGPIESLSLKEWDQQLNLNLRAAFLLTQIVLPEMKKNKKGNIVFINSIAGLQVFSQSVAYVASKFALRGFAGSLREELRKCDIKVMSVYPGAINTPFWDKLDNDFNREEMLDVFDCAKMILKNISSPGNLAVEDLVFRRLAGDF